MVAGGNSNAGLSRIMSTEILIQDSTSWLTLSTGNLPSARNGLMSASLNNKIFMFGKYVFSYVILSNPKIKVVMMVWI